MDSVDAVFEKFVLDKHISSKCHDYGAAYAKLLEPLRESARAVFEIGIGCVEHGQMSGVVSRGYRTGNSLRAWSELFPHAQIVGMDIFFVQWPAEDADGGRVTTVMGDQSCAADLQRAIDVFGGSKLDVVVDDGSHNWEHQAFSFMFLHRFLRVGGVYVIEDIQAVTKFMDLSAFPAYFREIIRANFKIQMFDTRKSSCRDDDFMVAFTRIHPTKTKN